MSAANFYSAFAQLTMEAGSEYENAATCTDVTCEVDAEYTDATAAYNADVAAKAALVAYCRRGS